MVINLKSAETKHVFIVPVFTRRLRNIYHRNYPPSGDNGDIDLESAPDAKN